MDVWAFAPMAIVVGILGALAAAFAILAGKRKRSRIGWLILGLGTPFVFADRHFAFSSAEIGMIPFGLLALLYALPMKVGKSEMPSFASEPASPPKAGSDDEIIVKESPRSRARARLARTILANALAAVAAVPVGAMGGGLLAAALELVGGSGARAYLGTPSRIFAIIVVGCWVFYELRLKLLSLFGLDQQALPSVPRVKRSSGERMRSLLRAGGTPLKVVSGALAVASIFALIVWTDSWWVLEDLSGGSITVGSAPVSEEAATSEWDKAASVTKEADRLRDGGQAEEALALYDKAIAESDEYGPAYYGKGLALLKLKDYEEARDWYRKTTERFPRSGVAWWGLGYSEESLSHFSSAIQHYKKSLEYQIEIPLDGAQELTAILRGEEQQDEPTMLEAAAQASSSMIANIKRRIELLDYVDVTQSTREGAYEADSRFVEELSNPNPNRERSIAVAAGVRMDIGVARNLIAKTKVPPHFENSHRKEMAGYDQVVRGLDLFLEALGQGDKDKFDQGLALYEAGSLMLDESSRMFEGELSNY